METDQAIAIKWTTDDMDEARIVASKLVENQWVACAQIHPHVESIYQWNGTIIRDQEILVSLKTSTAYIDRISETIIQIAKYENPQIIYHPIEIASENYQTWFNSCLE